MVRLKQVRARAEDQQAIEAAKLTISDNLPQLIDRALDLANGVLVQETVSLPGQGSEERVYRRPPDVKAIQFLYEACAGRAGARSKNETPHTITFEERIAQFKEARAAKQALQAGQPPQGAGGRSPRITDPSNEQANEPIDGEFVELEAKKEAIRSTVGSFNPWSRPS